MKRYNVEFKINGEVVRFEDGLRDYASAVMLINICKRDGLQYEVATISEVVTNRRTKKVTAEIVRTYGYEVQA